MTHNSLRIYIIHLILKPDFCKTVLYSYVCARSLSHEPTRIFSSV